MTKKKGEKRKGRKKNTHIHTPCAAFTVKFISAARPRGKKRERHLTQRDWRHTLKSVLHCHLPAACDYQFICS